MTVRRTTVALSLLMWSAAVPRPAPAAEAPVTLALRSEAGAVLTYRYESTVRGDVNVQIPERPRISVQPRIDLTALYSQRTVRVADNGEMTLAFRLHGFDTTLEGSNVRIGLAIRPDPAGLVKLPEIPVYVRMTPSGKTAGIEGLEDLLSMLPIPDAAREAMPMEGMMQQMLDNFAQPLLPEKPVRVGDSWGWEKTFRMGDFMPMGGGMAPGMEGMPPMEMPMAMHSTFTGWETVNGVRCAKIDSVTGWSMQMDIPTGDETGSGVSQTQKGQVTTTLFLDVSAGRIARQTGAVTYEFGMSFGGTPMVTLRFAAASNGELTANPGY